MIKQVISTQFGVEITLNDGKVINVSPNEEKVHISFSGLGADVMIDSHQLAANNIDLFYKSMVGMA